MQTFIVSKVLNKEKLEGKYEDDASTPDSVIQEVKSYLENKIA